MSEQTKLGKIIEFMSRADPMKWAKKYPDNPFFTTAELNSILVELAIQDDLDVDRAVENFRQRLSYHGIEFTEGNFIPIMELDHAWLVADELKGNSYKEMNDRYFGFGIDAKTKLSQEFNYVSPQELAKRAEKTAVKNKTGLVNEVNDHLASLVKDS